MWNWMALDGNWARRLGSRLSAFGYRCFDPVPQKPARWFGFTPVAVSLDPAEVAARVQRPGDPAVVVERVQEQLTPAHGRRFRHEEILAAEFRTFEIEAGSLLDGAPDPWELSRRIRALVPHGDCEPPLAGPGPLAALRLAHAGIPLTCRPFALLHVAACQSQGYTARMLGLSRDGIAFDHAVTEVYVPAAGKWVVIDCDFNLAYRRNGVWQSAGELHQAWNELRLRVSRAAIVDRARDPESPLSAAVTRELTGVEAVALSDAGADLRRSNMQVASTTSINLEFYDRVFYPKRNNYLTGHYPPGHPSRWKQYVLQASPIAPPIAPEAYVMHDPRAQEWPVGTVSAEFVGIVGSTVKLQLSTWTPNFLRFEVQSDNQTWQTSTTGEIAWPLHSGENRLQARSVNAGGLHGQPVTLRVEVPRMCQLLAADTGLPSSHCTRA